MKIESWFSDSEKRRWKIVRADYFNGTGDVPCDDIISADEFSGECYVRVGGEPKTLAFGTNGIRLVAR